VPQGALDLEEGAGTKTIIVTPGHLLENAEITPTTCWKTVRLPVHGVGTHVGTLNMNVIFGQPMENAKKIPASCWSTVQYHVKLVRVNANPDFERLTRQMNYLVNIYNSLTRK